MSKQYHIRYITLSKARYPLWSAARLSVPLANTLPTMVNDQIFRTPNKHVTHYTMINDQTFCNIPGNTLQTRYPLWSAARLSVPLANTLPTMVNDQNFRTPVKHVTHYTMVNDQTFVPLTNTLTTMINDQTFRTPTKHVTHYGQRPDFPYP